MPPTAAAQPGPIVVGVERSENSRDALALARTLAAQIAPKGVTVNCVVPGFTRKDASGHSALSQEAWRRSIAKVPMGRGCTPADVLEALYYLVHQRYEPGQALPVTGGQVMLGCFECFL